MVLDFWVGLFVMLFLIFEILYTLIVSISVSTEADKKEISILAGTKNFLISLFKGRNLFGIFMSCFVVVISIPTLVLLVLTYLIIEFLNVLAAIWDMGNKQENIE